LKRDCESPPLNTLLRGRKGKETKGGCHGKEEKKEGGI